MKVLSFGICEEGIYRNVFGSVLMFRCRTNTLRLRWRDGYSGGDVDCLLRGAEKCSLRVEEVLMFEGRIGKGLIELRRC